MKSILDITVSGFANYQSTKPKDTNLLKWLTLDKYADKVKAIRTTADKAKRDKRKALLPAITPSGVFSERKAAGLKQHSRFIQFDIDNVTDLQQTKQKIGSIENVAYCGLSVSGHGLWGLIPIAAPEHHKEHFTFIQKAFASMDITIDAACKDVCRLRGYSYDPDAYFNHSAKPLQKWYMPAGERRVNPVCSRELKNNVEACLDGIEAFMIDLTPTYGQWFKMGCSFANTFGEAGRRYYHRVSQFYPYYTPNETDTQFNRCLKSGHGSISISTFFAACKEAGINYKPTAAEDFKDVIIK